MTLDKWSGTEKIYLRIYSNIVGDGTGLIVDGIAEILPAIPKWEKPYGVLGESNGLPRSFFANVRPAISTDNVLRIYRDTRRMPLATDVGSSTAQSDEVIDGLMAPLLRLRKNGLSLPPKPRNQNGIVVELPKALISPENSDSSVFAVIAKPSKEKPSDRMLFVVESQSHWNTHYRYCALEKVGWTSCRVEVPVPKDGENLFLRVFPNVTGDDSGVLFGGFL